MTARLSRPSAALALFVLSGLPASAHSGIGAAHGVSHGFGHPLGGLDHLLAMVAVGLLAARIGGRALWLVPGAFLVAMAAGGALGLAGVALPLVELGIVGSVVVLGAVIAFGRTLPLAGAMVLAAVSAVFHGHAHGAEMPADASGLAYGLGFLAATALLHAAGVGIGIAAGRFGSAAARLGGGAIALAGIALLAG